MGTQTKVNTIRFVRATDKSQAINQIISEINSLKYEDTGQTISYQDKVRIVETIQEYLSGELLIQYRDGGYVPKIEEKDNQSFLDMVDYLLGQLKR